MCRNEIRKKIHARKQIALNIYTDLQHITVPHSWNLPNVTGLSHDHGSRTRSNITKRSVFWTETLVTIDTAAKYRYPPQIKSI